MTNLVRWVLRADDQVSTKLAKLRDNFDRLGKSKGAATILQGVGMGAGISAWGLLERGISGAVGVMGDAIKGAIEDEKSIARLTTSLAANTTGWAGQTKAIEETLAARVKLGFADEDQRDSLSALVPATKDVTEALEVQRVAMDLARFKGISLAEATEALVKVEAGSYRILKSLGIELRTGATRTEALAAVQKVAAGQAESYANTIEGRVLVATTRFDEKMEDLGAKTLPLVSGALDTLIRVMDDVDEASPESFADLWVTLMKLNPALWGTQVAMGALGQEAKDTAEQANELKVIGYHMKKAEDAASDLHPEFNEVAKSLRGIEKEAKDALVALGMFKWDPAELKGNFAEARQAVIDAKKELREFQRDLGKKEPTAAQQRELDMLNGKLAETQQAAYEAEVAMLAVDGLSFEDAIRTVNKYGLKVDWLGDQWLRVLRVATRVNKEGYLDPGVGGVGGTSGVRASGGPVRPFGTYTVGEEGPETLIMGARGGYVIPGAPGGGGGGGGAPVTIALQLDGRTVAEVVDRHLYYKAARAPRSTYAG